MFINIVVPVLVVAFGAMFSHQGWLDEAIKNEKEKFLNEFVSFVPITNDSLSSALMNLSVTLMKAPPGFKDSPGWDEESVIRLLMLLEISNARPVRKALYRALGPSRRFLSGNKTEELFPSWGRDHPNYFYYDYEDENITDYHQDEVVTDDTVLFVSNPVESRLPGPMLTVKLLREIMEKRAEGLRKMPTTTRRPRYSHHPQPPPTTTKPPNHQNHQTTKKKAKQQQKLDGKQEKLEDAKQEVKPRDAKQEVKPRDAKQEVIPEDANKEVKPNDVKKEITPKDVNPAKPEDIPEDANKEVKPNDVKKENKTNNGVDVRPPKKKNVLKDTSEEKHTNGTKI